LSTVLREAVVNQLRPGAVRGRLIDAGRREAPTGRYRLGAGSSPRAVNILISSLPGIPPPPEPARVAADLGWIIGPMKVRSGGLTASDRPDQAHEISSRRDRVRSRPGRSFGMAPNAVAWPARDESAPAATHRDLGRVSEGRKDHQVPHDPVEVLSTLGAGERAHALSLLCLRNQAGGSTPHQPEGLLSAQLFRSALLMVSR
jgi:hypothetical protein